MTLHWCRKVIWVLLRSVEWSGARGTLLAEILCRNNQMHCRYNHLLIKRILKQLSIICFYCFYFQLLLK